ncbi:trimethyllysine dioxygenase [Malassezia japonica]|uniref:trimethyllysine dioxygenase n=1 Tax=Malassezia japonica TaxID=223818 RepID=A0AAF0F0L1_9BASI|nr:trimethyllysine dioxygenase [Malassezia japonica]WFD38282.1 trimethyllysine dioxygenase [Malassezia japonica]
MWSKRSVLLRHLGGLLRPAVRAAPKSIASASCSAHIPRVRTLATQPVEPLTSLPQVESSPKSVAITWPSGTTSRFHYLWLRDHCRCAECYHATTKQRLLDTFQIPTGIQPERMSATPDGLHVVWGNEQHTSVFPWQWLMRHAYSAPKQAPSGELTFGTSGVGAASHGYGKTVWGSEIASVRPTVEYEGVMESDDVLLDWLNNIDRYGFSFVSGMPTTPEATEAVIRRIAFIRETHYGGFWDFTSDLAHGDTAYTDIALGAHTDTTYFTDPAGLQMFHLLHHYSKDQTDFRDKYTGTPLGGSSLLVDGFYAAQQLHARHPELYNVLRTTRLRGHSAGDEDTLILPLLPSGYTVFEHDPLSNDLVLVRYNNSDRSVLQVDEDKVEAVYEALRAWNAIITDPGTEYWFPLQPGTGMIFDNHRVLHGRSQFVGSRRLCGAYVPHDDYRSKLSVLRNRKMHDTRSVWDEGL